MKYVCVMLSKETVDKQVFNTKQEALECFDGKFGQELKSEANKKLNSLNNRLAKLNAEYTGGVVQDEKLAKTYSEIEAQQKLLANPLVDYAKRTDPWRSHFVFDETGTILHMGSIYCRPGRYEVVEDKHYVRFEELEYEGDTRDLFDELYLHHKGHIDTIYILTGDDALDRAIQKVVKLRSQVVRDYRKITARL